MREKRWRTTNDIVDFVDLSYGFALAILKSYLNTRRVSVKLMPRLLTTKQKEYHIEVSRDLSQRVTLHRRITSGNDSWVLPCDFETMEEVFISTTE